MVSKHTTNTWNAGNAYSNLRHWSLLSGDQWQNLREWHVAVLREIMLDIRRSSSCRWWLGTGVGFPGSLGDQGWQSSRSIWKTLSGVWVDPWDGPVKDQELDSIILVRSFQFDVFCDSMQFIFLSAGGV